MRKFDLEKGLVVNLRRKGISILERTGVVCGV